MGAPSLLAILLSPVVAVLVSLYIQHRKERKATKLWIFNTLIATRHAPMTDERVRALNMVDVVFHDAKRVRQLWHEYFDMLSNEGLNNEPGWEQQQKTSLLHRDEA